MILGFQRFTNGVLLFITLSIFLVGCEKARSPDVFEIPDGFTGWILVEYGKSNCPPLAKINGKLILRIGTNGRLCTGEKFEEGWALDEYYFVGSSHAPQKIADSGAGCLIWGTAIGNQKVGAVEKTYMNVFVGSKTQFDKAEMAPNPE